MHLKSKQEGSFTVEFALIGVMLSFVWAFSGDIIIKMSTKGKLDRLSYSLVNILKERTQLYEAGLSITQEDALVLSNIATNSLSRTVGAFDSNKLAVVVEARTYDPQAHTDRFGPAACQPNGLERLDNLSVLTTWDRQAPLYRVTICYETDNWIGSLLGQEYQIVSSSSILIGR
ncbi:MULTISPECIES: tight adherence pilus pseudopilin TadF [Vibrio]|uniref:ATP-binding protein n=1 Tax=Vibrio coralliilyticus TaxID=190893 RepID=A0AAP6ZSL4_9VIBR|nr:MULTISPECIES: tight adherence pilus pseudopilin TadF [Vibrio]EEX34230.1 Flp pilus assembly surface protein TadF [Vibrio coralliilyticus ATCC BAA-450]MDE3898637.1 ATP-binding protein [Vibrio sp. CC007]NOJ24257.1 ATP-binding protein [Vibrio coralliilyticus]